MQRSIADRFSKVDLGAILDEQLGDLEPFSFDTNRAAADTFGSHETFETGQEEGAKSMLTTNFIDIDLQLFLL